MFDVLYSLSCRNAAHGFSLIPVDSLKVTMKEILQKALKKRKGSQKGSGKLLLNLTILLSDTFSNERERGNKI